MSVNQLPENMGKKIVEALKKQAMLDEQNNAAQMSVNENVNLQENTVSDNQYIKEQPYINENIAEETVYGNQNNAFANQNYAQSYNQPVKENPMQFSLPNSANQPQNTAMFNAYSPELPTNVAVLKNLIFHLPSGVSKQVGAQIIRQTIEALGISMNSVLQEAQQVQETLNNSVTDCTIKIQEYKNQIMQLEANTRDYQRQMGQINDLISLFILTDNKK
ncbi:MAG: hypothetical protein K6C94_03490 [Candidatus Gastranaerophilales bacterium]|nr:hypothetical protein [Candidatus Gastranaerophilales bacterium]